LSNIKKEYVKIYTTETDIELIDLIRNGDDEAFKEIVIRHEKLVAKIISGILGKTDEADDLGQETFIRFYQSIGQFRGDAKVSTYLARISINLSLNAVKRKKSRNWISIWSAEDQELDIMDESHFDTDDLNGTIERALQGLSPDFRSVVVLRLMQGYSTKETAQILEIQQGTVLSRLSRAQEKLKKILSAWL
jgi:RNA polymerase sigma-70 factor (ECF subfamily)